MQKTESEATKICIVCWFFSVPANQFTVTNDLDLLNCKYLLLSGLILIKMVMNQLISWKLLSHTGHNGE